MINLRPARFEDFPLIQEMDEFLGDRRLDLQSGLLTVAEAADQNITGYARVDPSCFLGWPCLTSLCVGFGYRRTGVGSALLLNAQQDERYTRLFTTTEQSNIAMHKLLDKVGAWKIGALNDLNLSGETEIAFRLK